MIFLLGSDPEAFIVNNHTGRPVSSKRFTTGTKDEPEDLGNGFALLNDNILIEGNVPPARNKEEFIENMTKLWNMMNARAERRLAHLENWDVMTISNELMQTDEAKEFGCSSFRDAWNDLVEIDTPQLTSFSRPAGCHIHIGFEDPKYLTDSFKQAVVRAFDIFVTIPAIAETGQNYRTNNMYGILGACRIKSYGVECRSLGGTFFKPEKFGWIYEQTEKAIRYAEENQDLLLSYSEVTTYSGPERIARIKEVAGIK